MHCVTDLGLRERKKQETRRALVLAALSLVEARGLDEVTVDAIAEEAGVSPRTFFNHFASKEDAVLGVRADEMEALRDELAGRPATEAPLEALRNTFLDLAGRIDRDPEEWACRLALVEADPRLHDRFAGTFARFERSLREVMAGRLDVPPDHGYPELVVASGLVAARVAMQRWQASGGERHLPDVVRETFAVLEAGLAPPRG